jgi:hypothetical protein
VDVLCCRRKNPEKPHNRYLVAVYKCREGFSLQDPSVDRLYCSDDKWVGEEPVCTATSNDSLHFFFDTFVLFSLSFLFFKFSFSHFFEQENEFRHLAVLLCMSKCVALGISFQRTLLGILTRLLQWSL